MEQNLQKIVKSRKKYKSNFLENLYSMLEVTVLTFHLCYYKILFYQV